MGAVVTAMKDELTEGGGGSSAVAHAPKQPVELELREEKSVLAVTVVVQPAELFVDNTNQVTDLACTDNYVVVMRKTASGGPEYVIYNEAGQKVAPNKPIPTLGPRISDIPSWYSGTNGPNRKNYVYIMYPGAIDSQDTVTIPEIVKALRLPESRGVDIYSALKGAFPEGGYVQFHQLLGSQRKLVELETDIKSDSTRSCVVFQHGKILNVYLTQGKSGVLHPNDWTLVEIKDNSKITSAQLAEMPFLREFLDTQKGRLIGDLDLTIDNDRGILNVIDTKKNVRVYSDSSVGYALDPSDKKTIYYYNSQSGELKTFDATKASLTQTPVRATKLPFPGTVKDFKLDPQGNFILMIVEEGKTSKLQVLEKDTLALAATVPDITGPLECDNLGNIYFVDSQKRLRLAQTNFMTFAKGGIESARTERKAELVRLSQSIGKLALPDDEQQALTEIPLEMLDEERIKQSLARQIEERFGPLVEAAMTTDDLESLGRRLTKVRVGTDFKNHPDIFAGIDEKIEERSRSLQLDTLSAGLKAFAKSLEAATTVAEVLDLDRELLELSRARRDVVIKNPEVRKEVDETLRNFERQKSEKYIAFAGQLEQLLTEKFAAVTDLIAESGTSEELSDILADKRVQDFEALLASIRDRSVSGAWKMKYRDAMIAQRGTLATRENEAREEEMMHHAELLEDAREVFGELRKAVSEQTSVEALQKWQVKNPVIIAYRAKLLPLPTDLREAEEAKLTELIMEKQRDLERRVVMSLPKSGGVVKFGTIEFPIFQSPRIVWQPKVIPSVPGATTGALVFKDSAGRVYTPEAGVLPVDLSNQVTKDAIAQHRDAAEKYFETRTRKVPAFDSTWVVNEHNRETLGKMAKLAGIQIERKRGILILEGEAGTGKNVNVDMFAHFTNRESFTFSCNFQSEKEDLTYAFKFDPARGSYQVDSKLLEMLQTPGAIIVLDEINTLPPGVLKMLNPLLDYRRTMYLPDGREIKADPSVIIVGTMNPQHYLGVKPLSPEVKSRSRIMFIDYPPEKIGAKSAAYEAEILAKFVPCLATASQSEFYAIWDSVINRDSGNGADKFLTKDREQAVKNLSQIVRTANKIREAYKNYRIGASNDPIDFVFSLRETIDIAAEMTSGGKVRDAIEEVILPKISDPAEKERVKAIVRSV